MNTEQPSEKELLMITSKILQIHEMADTFGINESSTKINPLTTNVLIM